MSVLSNYYKINFIRYYLIKIINKIIDSLYIERDITLLNLKYNHMKYYHFIIKYLNIKFLAFMQNKR